MNLFKLLISNTKVSTAFEKSMMPNDEYLHIILLLFLVLVFGRSSYEIKLNDLSLITIIILAFLYIYLAK